MTTIIRDIPLSKLVPSAQNVRRTRREAGIEELAASIAAHGLLQSLSVRPVLDGEGAETGKFEVIGGGRRLAALKLLVKRKQAPKSAPVPCVIVEGEGEELSLAENVVRESLHPADQFEAFKRLADEHSFGAEEIAARFGVTPQVVRQRLRLGTVSPKLMQVYREGGLTLDQLMAFGVTEDHGRQEDAFARLSWNREPGYIRRMLTEGHVSARDRRAVFVGAAAYEAAGGTIVRDLFTEDGGGWFEDATLLDRLVLEKLERVAEDVRAEGWKWVEVCIDYPYAHGLSRAYPLPAELPPEDQARLDTLSAEWDELAQQYDGIDDLPEDIAARLDALNAEIERLSAQRHAYDPDAIARGGAYVVLGHDGAVRIERGFVRPEDEPETESADPAAENADTGETDGETVTDEDEGDHDESKPLSDSLVRDLMAHRTLGLRIALGENPDIALLAVTHAVAARTFFRGEDDGSCLDIRPNSAFLGGHADGIGDTAAAQKLGERHASWAAQMPADVAGLWDFVVGLDHDSRMALFAHCAALTVFAVRIPWDPRPKTLAMADALAQVLALDMTAYWSPTARSYFGRVTKAHILAAVREGVSDEAADQMVGMKKQEMAEAAEQLVAGTGWLPALLRTPEAVSNGSVGPADGEQYAHAAE
ncbi:ParB/RepB/Spo0J family partition protein [Inquilinus sp. NPDC058860]|uniref:ParB/RepB/Spo0J family partition protein n=1 Tax=Inquilinus sp. NPDC058860 TaxID=3346652 RepID=UPI00369DFD91